MRSPKLAAPFQFLVFLVAGWISQRQQLAIEYLQAENRVLRGRLGTGRLLFTDAERKLLAEKGEALGRAALSELATLVTPETILRLYRRLIAAKYDGSQARRSPGRPPTATDVTEQVVPVHPYGNGWPSRCTIGDLRVRSPMRGSRSFPISSCAGRLALVAGLLGMAACGGTNLLDGPCSSLHLRRASWETAEAMGRTGG